MKSLHFALIGCGTLGRTHAACVTKIQGAAFTAYVDSHLPAAEAALHAFGGELATTDVARVLDDPRIDAVYICTRHDSHAELAIAAARAGKHILCEKPLALTEDACAAIATAVEGAGVFFMPAFKLRYYPLVQKARAFLPRPQVLVGQMMDARWPDTLWAQDPIQGGANVHSQGCHTTDLLRYFADSEPAELWAAGGAMTHPGHPCIDQCVASIRFESGSVASWIQGDAGLAAATSKFYIGLFGDGRSVQLTDRFKRATFFDGEKTWTETCEEEDGFQIENQVFITALKRGEAPELTAWDGLQATRLVLAADRAIRSGQVQQMTCSPRTASSFGKQSLRPCAETASA